MTEENREAYLYQVKHTDKCEFNFRLSYEKNNLKLDTDIRAVRQTSENLNSLGQHIINIINFHLNKKLKEAKELSEEPHDQKLFDISIRFSQSNYMLKGKTCLSTILNRMKPFNFEIDGKEFVVYVNQPKVESMNLPEIIYVGSHLTPIQIKAKFMIFKYTKCFWYTSKEKDNWSLVWEGPSFTPGEEHKGCFVKLICEPRDEFGAGTRFEVISKDFIRDVPKIPDDLFEGRHQHTKEFLEDKELRIVSYNTLANRYVEGQFLYCAPEVKAIDYRKQLILKELLGYNADIICLQEVDHTVYQSYLSKKFQEQRYGTVFHKKGNRLSEGLMMIYNKKRLKLKKSHQVVLSDLVKSSGRYQAFFKILQKDKILRDNFFKQATSLQYCIFESLDVNYTIVVANTHLYYHQDAGHIRLMQTLVSLEFLKFVLKEIQDLNTALIFCGDFNSKPKSSSYEFLINGTVDLKHEEVLQLNLSKELKHSLSLKSACGTPKFTNYVSDFKDCLDYIFIQQKHFCVKNVVPLPTEEELSEYVALPSPKFPSDHVALIADLKIL